MPVHGQSFLNSIPQHDLFDHPDEIIVVGSFIMLHLSAFGHHIPKFNGQVLTNDFNGHLIYFCEHFVKEMLFFLYFVFEDIQFESILGRPFLAIFI